MMTVPQPLHDLILNCGEITFCEFMQQALYAPDFGYYTNSISGLGQSGDFVTAPELTPLFGQTLARQCQEVLTQLNHPIIFEFGAGSARLCVDILKYLEQQDALPNDYVILDVSGRLRALQEKTICQEIPHLAQRIHWLNEWPQQPFSGIILANEVIDAMPVHRFLQDQTDIYESYIELNAQGNLIEQFKPCSNAHLNDYIQTHVSKTAEPYQSEVNLLLGGWLTQCSAMLTQGVMLIIDYGFPRAEYYHPERNQGTLMCHYRHKAHTNPLIHIGKQDITAHVDFTKVAEDAIEAGFAVAGYSNQASFLLAAGLPQLLAAITDEPARSQALVAAKTLLQPHEMGELFKVMALSKQYSHSLQGFSLFDKSGRLF